MSRETCPCRRPMLIRPGDLHPSCGGCRSLPDWCDCEPLRADPDPEQELRLIAGRYTPVDWEAAWAAKPDAVNWLVEPFIEAGTVNALYAAAGTGKSLLSLEWALRLARAGHPVVYVDEENRLAEEIVDRLQSMGAVPAELAPLVFYSFAGLPPLDTPHGGQHLLALAVTAAAQLVVLDTSARMIMGKENDSDTWLALYNHAVKPLKARGIAVLRLDHPGKDAERGMRGSSAKNGDVDTVWKLTEIERGKPFFRMDREKSRSGHGPEMARLERKFAPLRHVWTVRDSTPILTPLGQLCGQLSRLQVPPSAGRDRCRTALAEAGIPVRNDLLSDVVKHRKMGCNCPGQPGTAGTVQSHGGELSPTPPHTEGVGVGTGLPRPVPDTLGDWPEGSIGEESA